MCRAGCVAGLRASDSESVSDCRFRFLEFELSPAHTNAGGDGLRGGVDFRFLDLDLSPVHTNAGGDGVRGGVGSPLYLFIVESWYGLLPLP